jgi:hypothetical protein
MRKTGAWVIPMIIVALAIVIVNFFEVETPAANPYTSFSAGDRGSSLFFDTLLHMGYNVQTSHRPLNRYTSTDYIYVIIQPRMPAVNSYMAAEMLEWVRRGGRLIFLSRNLGVINHEINMQGRQVGDFTHYRLGYGEILTGSAFPLTNSHLMSHPEPGQLLHATIANWNAQGIFFAEYYHGFHASENFLGGLPLVIRLVLAQLVIFVIVTVRHLGKRFGNPTPFYQETEREENEYVRALARLYMESDRKKKR